MRFARRAGWVFAACLLASCATDTQPNRAGREVFPEVKDWNSLEVSSEVKAVGLCIGMCSIYSVEVHGDGTVIFNGKFDTLAHGEHRAHIPPEAVRKLFERARTFEYKHFLDQVEIPEDAYIVDSTIFYDGSVVADGGYELAEAIDDAADTESWLSGNRNTASRLRAEGWDFSRVDRTNLEMLTMAARTRTVEVVQAFLDQHFPVSGEAGAAVGCRALSAAVEGPNWGRLIGSERSEYSRRVSENSRRDSIARMLVAAGAPAQWKADRCDAVIRAAAVGALEPMRLFLTTHPDITAKDESGRTALTVAAAFWTPEEPVDRSDYPAIIRMLLAAGARDPQQLNAALATAARNRNAYLVRFFLSAGANPAFLPEPR